jgi:hypothetical protein
MHPLRKALLATFLLPLLAGAAAAQTVATAQWNPAMTFSTYSLFGYDGGRDYEGMTWLAGETGLLESFSIRIWSEAAPAPDQDMIAWLYEAAGAEPSGPVLATAVAPAAALSPGAAVMLDFDFSAAGVLIEAGRTYAVAVGPENLYQDVRISMNGALGDLYAEGNSFDSFDLGATWNADGAGLDIPFQAVVDQTGVPVVSAGFGRIKAAYGAPD